MAIPFSAVHKQNLLRNYLAAGYNTNLIAVRLRDEIALPGAAISGRYVVETLRESLEDLRQAFAAMPKELEDIVWVQNQLADYGYTGDVVVDAQAVETARAAIITAIVNQGASILPTTIDAQGNPIWPNLTNAQKNGLVGMLNDLIAATAG